ncbi:MAG TPA: hypothetical protein VE991_04125 [Acidimicrobiales bacterium]|nr:hypothetical protein [Acidimicrobiales bacterium]
MMRLRRSVCDGPGIRRRRRGRGFSYSHDDGSPVSADDVARIRALAVPPAWTDVWICPWPHGHIQAVGTDNAGRRQYRYHQAWREQRDHEKFDRMTELGLRLPDLRAQVAAHLRRRGLPRDRVLAAAVRLLDTASFRIGGEEYAEENDTYGLASLRRRHLKVDGNSMTFDFPAKTGQRRIVTVEDAAAARVMAELKRRSGDAHLLACRLEDRWRILRADDVNAYIKAAIGDEFSAKDFRTWNATVLAAAQLASVDPVPASERGRRRAVQAAMVHVSSHLGNTPTVCRGSYVDPRTIERFRQGHTIRAALLADSSRRAVETAVLDLLGVGTPLSRPLSDRRRRRPARTTAELRRAA